MSMVESSPVAVTLPEHVHVTGEMVVEASELGLAPGIFPHVLRVENRDSLRGRLFGAVGVDRLRGEVTGVRYEDEQGRRLLVIND